MCEYGTKCIYVQIKFWVHIFINRHLFESKILKMHIKCLFIQIWIVIISELNIMFRYSDCVTGSSPRLDEGSLHMSTGTGWWKASCLSWKGLCEDLFLRRMVSRRDLLWQNYAYYFYAKECHLDSVTCSAVAGSRKRWRCCNVSCNFKVSLGTVHFSCSSGWENFILEMALYRAVWLQHQSMFSVGCTWCPKYNHSFEIGSEWQAAKGSLCVHGLLSSTYSLICPVDAILSGERLFRWGSR